MILPANSSNQKKCLNRFSIELEFEQIFLRRQRANDFRHATRFERMNHVACQYVAKGHLQIEIRTLIFDQAV